MGLRVLLVEDNPDHALLTRRALEREESVSCVAICADGVAALDLLSGSERAPDLILVDVRLPGISGLDFLDAVRSMPSMRGVPVVLLSSSASESQVNEAIKRGASAFITKPLRPGRLIKGLFGRAPKRNGSGRSRPKHGDEFLPERRT